MHPFYVFLFTPLLTSLVSAQSLLYTFDGDGTATSLSGAGDVNADGYDDTIVGSPLADNNGVDSGSISVFSGKDGTVLYTLDGDGAGDNFGGSVSDAGDVNLDGYADVVVSATGDDLDPDGTPGTGDELIDAGRLSVFSGKDGTVLYTLDGDGAGDNFGFSLSRVGDVNADGYDDVIVGANLDDNNGVDSGSARVFSGKDGSILHTFNGDAAGDNFGVSVSGAGDVDADGIADVIVGANLGDNNGARTGCARVFSALGWTILFGCYGDSVGDNFGISVSGAGDVNGDGHDDVIVGANLDDNNGVDSGSARVFSGKDGSILQTFNGDNAGDNFGISVSDVGDMDADSFADVLVGADGYDGVGPDGTAGTGDDIIDGGRVTVFSGKLGQPIRNIFGSWISAELGTCVFVKCKETPRKIKYIIIITECPPLLMSNGGVEVYSGDDLPLVSNAHLMSVSSASSQTMTIDAGVANAGKSYWLFTGFGVGGDTPGVTMAPGVVIPLNQPDPLTSLVIGLTQLGGGAPTFVGWKSTLNGAGMASPSLSTFGPTPAPVGITLHHAALVYTSNGCGVGCDTFQLATNWVPLTTIP